MHASMFNLDLGVRGTSRDRARRGRAMAAALAELPGLVALIAIEGEDGMATGLCICMNGQALERARRVAEAWQRAQREQETASAGSPERASNLLEVAGGISVELLASGEVIVQRGF